MSDDGQNEPQSIADALAQADDAGDKEDATVQISKAELAAIRESASNPALTPEVLREINRRREGGAVEDDDPTQTFDRSSLNSLLEQQPPPTTQPAEPAEQPSTSAEEHSRPTEEVELSDADVTDGADEVGEGDDFDVFDELADVDDLGELSEADLHAVVFGDDGPAPEPAPEPGEEADREVTPAAPESQSDEFDLLADEEFAALEELTEDELTDDDLSIDQLPKPQSTKPQSTKPQSTKPQLPKPQSTKPQPPKPQLPKPQLPKPQPPKPQPPKPQSTKPQSTKPQQPAPANLDEPITDFRSPESRILIVGALLGGVAMLVAGVLRLATSDMLASLHPALAGLMIAVGVLLLMGLLISFLQDRSH